MVPVLTFLGLRAQPVLGRRLRVDDRDQLLNLLDVLLRRDDEQTVVPRVNLNVDRRGAGDALLLLKLLQRLADDLGRLARPHVLQLDRRPLFDQAGEGLRVVEPLDKLGQLVDVGWRAADDNRVAELVGEDRDAVLLRLRQPLLQRSACIV